MAVTFEDLNPNQSPTETSIRRDLARLSENVHLLISDWQATVQAGGDPRANMPVVARALLGRLLRTYNFLQANPSELTALAAKINIIEANIINAIISRRDILRAFRDADLSTKANAIAAVSALKAAFPLPKPIPALQPFIADPLPTDW